MNYYYTIVLLWPCKPSTIPANAVGRWVARDNNKNVYHLARSHELASDIEGAQTGFKQYSACFRHIEIRYWIRLP